VASDSADDRSRRERVAAFALLGLGVALAGFLLFAYLNRPPQMGTSEEAFKTVDALYTAVRSRDENRLTESERRLRGHRETGKLPTAAADALDAIIRTARAGSWESATERLYDFMRAQRREGALTNDQRRDKKVPAARKP